MLERAFTKAANRVAHWAGMPATFILCCLIILVWAFSGPFFGFSDTWQLIINTGTTIVTFLMVFLIQNTQNRDSGAIQAKLDELIRVGRGHNYFIGIEHLSESEVEKFRARCEKAAREHDTTIRMKQKEGGVEVDIEAGEESEDEAAVGRSRGRSASRTRDERQRGV